MTDWRTGPCEETRSGGDKKKIFFSIVKMILYFVL